MTKIVSEDIWQKRTELINMFINGKMSAFDVAQELEISRPTLYIYARRLCPKELGGEGQEKLTDKRSEQKGYRPRKKKQKVA